MIRVLPIKSHFEAKCCAVVQITFNLLKRSWRPNFASEFLKDVFTKFESQTNPVWIILQATFQLCKGFE
jgi:hypothetical protein